MAPIDIADLLGVNMAAKQRADIENRMVEIIGSGLSGVMRRTPLNSSKGHDREVRRDRYENPTENGLARDDAANK